jgi:prevent-host-death family protein
MKGAMAEMAIAKAAVELGFEVWRPLVEGRRYDLIIDTGPDLHRVQCKCASRKGDVIVVRTSTRRLTPRGYVQTTYHAGEIDGFGVYCPELERCFWLPILEFAGKSQVHLRLNPARNRQRAWLIWADEYEFGAIAQLGERLHGMQEAGGSSPPSSIASSEAVATVGSHEFREHLGRYLEQVKAGRRLLLTRHGTPFARLEPLESERAAAESSGLVDLTQIRPLRDSA